MAKVLILTTRPEEGGPHEKLIENAAKDIFGVHSLTDDSEATDLILFVDSWNTSPFFEAARRHPYVQAYQDKCFCFSEVDCTVPFLPGVYTDVRKRWYLPSRVRTGFYLSKFDNPYVANDPNVEKKYLFAFLGSADTHPVRQQLMNLKHARGLVEDTSDRAYRIRWEGTEEEKRRFRERYGDVTRQSKFVLCPRGKATSSKRVFETMQTGCVPVIISDEWVPPAGPDWDAFSLRVAEKAVEGIPQLLEKWEEHAAHMGKTAREEWKRWYSDEVSFHRIIESCLDIQKSRNRSEKVLRFAAYPMLLFPPYFRKYVRSRINMYKRDGKVVF